MTSIHHSIVRTEPTQSGSVSLKDLQDFNAFVRLVTSKFGVTVEMDSNQACTDGKVIKVPNVFGMTKKELDFVYAILLHEAGHIKHSDFSAEAFQKLSTTAMFMMANAIEDARIENLLIAEFAGGEAIFKKLYGEFAVDRDMMSRVFGSDPSMADAWFAVGSYVHRKILRVDGLPDVMKSFRRRVSAEAVKFIADNNVDAMIASEKLDDWDSVVRLAKRIHKAFFRDKSDSSESVSIKKLSGAAEHIATSLDRAVEKAKEIVIKADADIVDSYARYEKQKSEIIDAAGGQDGIREANEELKELERHLRDLRKELHRTEKVAGRIPKLERRVDKLADDIDIMDQKIVEKTDRLSKTDEKLKGHEVLTRQISNLKERIYKKNEQIEDANAAIDSANDVADRLQEVKNNVHASEHLVTNAKKKVEQVDRDISRAEYDHERRVANLEEKKARANDGLVDALVKAHKALKDAGLPSDIVEEYVPLEGWDRANKEQAKFDDRASKATGMPVEGGISGFDTGNRNVMILMEKSAADARAIDIAKVFGGIVGISRAGTMNGDGSSELKNTTAAENDVIFDSQKKHVPITTEHDKVTMSNRGNLDEVRLIRTKHVEFIRKLKDVFARKLKSKHKNRFRGDREEGDLDNRSVWKIPSNTGGDFNETMKRIPVNQTSVTVAVDISGSHDKDNTGNGLKLREIAVALSDALEHCNVSHEVIGYHAPVNGDMPRTESDAYNRVSNSLETVVYKTFRDRGPSGIGNIDTFPTDNSDGESLRIVAARLKKERSRRRILIVVTDGKPYLSGSDTAVLDGDLASAIAEIRKAGTEIMAVGFNAKPGLYYGDNYCEVTLWETLIPFFERTL